MEIKPTYVTFEQAKWLKEKRFGLSENCYITLHSFYDKDGKLTTMPSVYKRNISKTHLGALTMDNVEVGISQGLDNSLDDIFLAPEQHQVVEWLRVNHGIWVEVRHIKTFGVNRFHIIIWKYGEEDYHTIHCGNGVGYEVWDTPQEAYSAAFDYVLNNNLI